MMIALEIFGAVAAALTIFSAGVAVGRFIEHKNDRHSFSRTHGRQIQIKQIVIYFKTLVW